MAIAVYILYLQKSPTDKDGMLHVFVGDTDKKKSTLQEKSTNELEKPMTLNRIDDQHGYFSLHGDKQYLDKIRTHSETVNMQGSQWKDNSASSKQQQLTLHIQCFHWKFLKPIHSWNKTFSKVGKQLCILNIVYLKNNGSNL